MSIVLRKLVEKDLAAMKKRRPGFSMRAYARSVATNPTSLSLFLRGKRGVSEATMRQLCKRVGLEHEHVESRQVDYEALDFALFDIMSNWYYFAILSLTEVADFDEDPRWISRRLGISLVVAKEAVGEMLRRGLLTRDSTGKLTASTRQFRTPDQVSRLSIRQHHAEGLELASESLLRDPVELRDFSSLTMAIDPSLLPAARKKIVRFRRALCQFLESGDKTEVYRLSVQLFPLSRKELP